MKALFSVVSAVAILGLTSAPTQAQTFRELMEDIGLQGRKPAKMDFSERAPLVLPPPAAAEALPPPEEPGSFAAANPNWPRDVEVQAELDAEENEARRRIADKRYMQNPAQQIYEIRRREREEGISYDAANAKPDDPYLTRKNMLFTPEELREVRDRKAAEAASAEAQIYVEPERKRLTDPPPGYLTPSVAQPYGPGEKGKKKGFLSKLNPFN